MSYYTLKHKIQFELNLTKMGFEELDGHYVVQLWVKVKWYGEMFLV